MRKRLRGVARLLAIVLLIATSSALLLVRPLDLSPQRVHAALDVSRERIRHARASLEAAPPLPLYAGWALRDITPDEPVPLAGYGARRGDLSEGATSALQCRALALRTGDRTLILVSLDLLLIPEGLGRRLRAAFPSRTGLPPDSLFLAPSHTHGAPDPWDHRLAAVVTGGGYRPAYAARLEQAVLEAAAEAVGRLEPAEWAMGRDWAPTYVRNRVRDAPLDAWIEWFAVRHTGRESFCLVVNYTAHATVLGASHRKADADYPGQFVAALEASERIDMALFQAGAVGSASPRPPPCAHGKDRPDRARALGVALANEVGALRGDLDWRTDAELAAALVDIQLPPFQFRLGMTGLALAPWASRRMGFGDEAPLHMARIGSSIMLGLPVELSAEISLGLKESLRTESGVDLWVVSMSTGYYGYLTPDELYGKRDARGRPYYEASNMAFLGPHAERYFRALITEAATGPVPSR